MGAIIALVLVAILALTIVSFAVHLLFSPWLLLVAVAILACSRQAPALLATLVACAEQELQRAAGAWHAEWQPLTQLLRLAGSAASWAAELLEGLVVDAQVQVVGLDVQPDLQREVLGAAPGGGQSGGQHLAVLRHRVRRHGDAVPAVAAKLTLTAPVVPPWR